MTVGAVVAVSPADFLLGATLTAERDVRVELERIVPLSPAEPAPYVRVVADEPDRVTERIREDGTVTELAVVERDGDERLLRVRWAPASNGVTEALGEADAACTRAVAADGRWHLSLRFPTHEGLARWYRRCRERDLSIAVERVREPAGLEEGAANTLTDCQRETLCAALDAGYFDVPRGITLGELAEQLGVSDTAASQRVRRGVRNVLAESLAGDSC